MSILTKKFSEFLTGSPSSTGKYVGLDNGANAIFSATVTWTTAGRPTSPANGQLGYNTTLEQYEYFDSTSASWIIIGTGTSILPLLASHNPGEGASLIGLEGSGTVQDLANASFITKTASSATPNGFALGSLASGVLRNTAVTGIPTISAPLTSIDSLTTVADKMLYTTAPNVYATTDLTAFSRTLLADGTASAWSTTLAVLPLAGGTMAGQINMGGFKITNGATPTASSDYATKGYVDSGAFLPLVGGTMSGQIDMGNQKIINLGDPTNPQDAVTQTYLSTQLTNYLQKAGGTMTGNINMNSHYITGLLDPVNPQDAATKNYVDLVATGLNVQPACYAATDTALTATYANGASGIGATLTNSGALAAFSTDGVSPPINSRILVNQQASTFQNGIYVLNPVGDGVTPWVLTRATDYDQPSEIQPGDLVVINNGAAYGGSSFIETATVTVIGTDPILWSQFTYSASAVLLKANNLSDVASTTTSFNNISPLTTKGDLLGYSTGNTRLAVGVTDGMLLQVKAAAATGLAWSTATYPSTTTVNQILYSSSTNVVGGISTVNGGVLVTNNTGVPSMLANPSAAGKVLQSGNLDIPAWSTSTYPSSAGATANKVLLSNGTDFVLSTPTFPNASATIRKIIVSDGTDWTASTETYATPGAIGNVMTSDGTNWVSSPPAATGTASVSNIMFLMGG